MPNLNSSEIVLETDSDDLSFNSEPTLAVESESSAANQTVAEELGGATSELLQGFKDRAAAEQQRLIEVTDSEYWVCMCFQTREQKDEFLAKLNLDALGDKYIDGMAVAKILGVTLESPVPGFRKTRHDHTFDELALEIE